MVAELVKVRRLEADDLLMAQPAVTLTGAAAVDAGGNGLIDDVERVGRVLDPQRDPDVGVGSHVVVDGTVRALDLLEPPRSRSSSASAAEEM